MKESGVLLLADAEMKPPEFLAIDFFCGAGGTTRGLIDAGGYVVLGVDKDPGCRETYELNNVNIDGAHSRYLNMDIFRKEEDYPEGEQEQVLSTIEQMLEPLRAKYPSVPVMLSICAPCQPFTSMTRIQMTDERAMARVRDRGLLGQTLDYVDRLKPEMILCENVAGIQAEKYGGVWQHFMAGLKERGYIVGSDVVDAARYGVPQYRKRSIMIAVHRGAMTAEAIRGWEDETDIDLKVPTEDANARPTTVGQALAHFPPLRHGETYADLPNHRCSRLTDINVRRLQAVKPGEKNTVFDGTDLALDCHKKMRTSDKPGGFTDVYTRLDPAKASPTITTKCCSVSNGRYGHFDVSQTRGLSVREAAALQSFPDNYEFVGKSLIHTAKMVGNAVPPRLAEFFGRYMAEMTKSFSIAYEGFERRSLNPS